MFRKKRSFRQEEMNRLIEQTEKVKQRLDHLNELINKSIDPSEEIFLQRKILKELYSFLLREVRYQRLYKNEPN